MRNVRDIIKDAGGADRISAESGQTDRPISVKGVYSWHRIGISDWHWPLIMRLSGVSERELLAANEALRHTPKPDNHRGRAA